MNKLILALLLLLPMTAHAQVSGPGNTFGGGGGSVDLTNVTTDINLTTPGASITIAPHPTAGSALVLDEGSNSGTHKFTMKVPDFSEGGLADDVMCKIDSNGVLNSECPFYPWAGGTAADILWAQVVAGTLASDPSSVATGANAQGQWMGIKTIYHTGSNINPSSFANPTCGSTSADPNNTNCYNAITLSNGVYNVFMSTYAGSAQTAAGTARCLVQLRRSVSPPDSGGTPVSANNAAIAIGSNPAITFGVNGDGSTAPASIRSDLTVTTPSGTSDGNQTLGVRTGPTTTLGQCQWTALDADNNTYILIVKR